MEKQNIIVLGHNGMLGNMACKYFKTKGFNVIIFNEMFCVEKRMKFISFLHKYPNAIIINCIALLSIKEYELNKMLEVNVMLPLLIATQKLENQILIHASTDCVFDGKKNDFYAVSEKTNAFETDYCWTKRMAEEALQGKKNTKILRTSIIGFNIEGNNSLLSWFLSNKKKSEIHGFTNHLWNGITTLEWCKEAEKIGIENDNSFKIIQLGTEKYYSKYHLLCLFQKVFQTDFKIQQKEAPQSWDLRLQPDRISQSLETQLIELKAFWETTK